MPQHQQLSIGLNRQLAQLLARVTLPQNKVHVPHATLPGPRAQGFQDRFGLFQVLAIRRTIPGDVTAVKTAAVHNVKKRQLGPGFQCQIYGTLGCLLALRPASDRTDDVLNGSTAHPVPPLLASTPSICVTQ